MNNKMKRVLQAAAAFSLFLSTACGGRTVASDVSMSQVEFAETQPSTTAATEEASVVTEPTAEQPEMLTKAQLYYRCMNTLEYLTQLSGSTSAFDSNIDSVIEGTFEFDFTCDVYHSVSDIYMIDNPEEPARSIETYVDNGEEIELFDYKEDGGKFYLIEDSGITLDTVVFANACPVSPSEAEIASANGDSAITSIEQLSDSQIFATWGQDPTNAHALGGFFIPQERTLGYLSDFSMWEITGTQEVQGRSCAVVQGTADPEYGGRFNVETFEILVDMETGVWMQYEGYDAQGNVQSYVYTENVRFGEDAQAVPAFTEECAEGYAVSEEDLLRAVTPTKAQLLYRCLYTLESLDRLSGSVTIRHGNTSPHIFNGEFQYDFTQDNYHTVVNAEGVFDPSISQKNEYYNNGQALVTLCDYSNEKEDIYRVEKDGLCPSVKDWVFPNAYPSANTNYLSEDLLCVGADPTGAHELGAFFVPGEMSIGYLSDFSMWEITGTQEVQGRSCAVVQGTADPEYGGRFNVETFEILVDMETGVWMQYEGYDAQGNVQSYVYTENVRFGEDAQAVPAFTEECAERYSLETASEPSADAE